jgi:hypothetical protein
MSHFPTGFTKIFNDAIGGPQGNVVVKALCYKPVGRGFDIR